MTLDDAVAAYRRALGDVADLAEIEDHLRALTDELRTEGMPAAAAVREACRRFGDPELLACEHARVRSPFGAPLSRARRYSVALLVLPFIVYQALVQPTGLAWFEVGICVVLTAALALGVGWGRPILLGALLPPVVGLASWCAVGSPLRAPLELVCFIGAIVFLAPWRRRELTVPGIALALVGPAYGAAATLFQLQITDASGTRFGHATAAVALGAIVVGSTGIVLRARWAALACATAGITLASLLVEVWPLISRGHAVLLGTLAAGVVAAAVATVLAARTARTTLGTLRGLFA